MKEVTKVCLTMYIYNGMPRQLNVATVSKTALAHAVFSHRSHVLTLIRMLIFFVTVGPIAVLLLKHFNPAIEI